MDLVGKIWMFSGYEFPNDGHGSHGADSSGGEEGSEGT